MSLLFKTAAEMQQLRLYGSCRYLGGIFAARGSFCSRGLALAWSDDKAQLVLFGNAGPCPAPAAGCRLLAARRLAVLLYLPFMARCSPYNNICSEAEVWDGWEMSGGWADSPCSDFYRDHISSGSIPGLTLGKVKCKVKQLGLKTWKRHFLGSSVYFCPARR